MMINSSLFKALGKQSAKSFNDQKALIKKVLAGRTMVCEHCKQVIEFYDKKVKKEQIEPAVIRCKKGCTDIELDIV